MTNPLDHALALADQGIPVFPVRADKRPACKHGHLDATVDPARIREMFEGSSAPLVGFPTGEASGIDVLDVDPRHDGDKWPGLDTLPKTRRHRTGSGGLHLYFAHAEGVRNSQSKIAAGIDVRGSGGYAISWPVEQDLDPAPWPADVLEAALRRPAPKPQAEPLARAAHNPTTDEARAALANAVRMIEEAAAGERYEVCKQATWHLSRLILGGFLDETEARAAVIAAAEAAGGEDMGKVERLFDGALEKAEPATVPGAEFDALPPETEEEIRAARGGRPRMLDRFLFPVDCETSPRRGYVIKHILAPGDVGALIGQPGSGKSILAPHLAYAVAQGRSAFGLRTKPGRTLYVAAEDASGMRQRVHALRLKHGDAPDFALVDCTNLGDPVEAADIRATVIEWKPALVVIDTLGAAFAGMDENSSQDMGNVVQLARTLAATGAAVLLVHHIAKQGDGSPRGHSVLNGTLDVSIALAPKDDDGIIRGSLLKNRNGTTDRTLAFRFVAQTLGQDEDGDTITAPLAVELAPETHDTKPLKLSAGAKAAMQKLREIAVNGETSESEWRRACDESRAVSASETADSRRRAFLRAYSELLKSGQIASFEGVVTIRIRNKFGALPDSESEIPDKRKLNEINGRTKPDSPGQRQIRPPAKPSDSGRTRTHPLGVSGCPELAGPTLEELHRVH
jgi:hypothetical protein